MELEVRDEDHDFFSRTPPEGWRIGCRPEDRSWIRYNTDRYPDLIDQVAGCVPPGYDDATAVFFAPDVGAGGTSWQWFAPDAANPWSSVLSLAENGVGDDRHAADLPLDDETGHALADALHIGGNQRYTCGYFLGNRAWTATGDALSLELGYGYGQHTDWDKPELFFPHDKRWFAVVLYDFGWLYLASSQGIAESVRGRPDLTTLPCRV